MPDPFALLMDGLLDGTLDEVQADTLLDRLRASPAATRHACALLALEWELRHAPVPGQARHFRDAVLGRAGTPAADDGPAPRRSRPPVRKRPAPRLRWPSPMWRVAAVLLTGVALLAMTIGTWHGRTTGDTIGQVEGVGGWVSVEQGERSRALVDGHRMVAGERIITGEDSRATVVLADGTRLALGASSWLLLPARDGARAHLEQGTVQATVTPQPPDAPAVLSTPLTSIHVLGTSFRVTVGDGATRVQVTSGLVEVRAPDARTWRVAPGESLRFDGTDARHTTTIDVRQRSTDPWRPLPIRSLPAATTPTPAPAVDVWGARTDRRLSASGRFQVAQDRGRWWAVTPDGRPLLLTGIADVEHAAGMDDTALRRLYPDAASWTRAMRSLLTGNGFSILGARSDHERFVSLDRAQDRPTPLVKSAEVAIPFTAGLIGRSPRLQALAGSSRTCQLLAPLLPGFRQHVERWAGHLPTACGAATPVVLVTDLFPRGGVHPDALRQLAAADPAIGTAIAAWLRGRGRSLATITADDLEALRVAAMTAYRDIVHPAARRALPMALFLGQFMALQDLSDPQVARILASDADAVAINLVSTWVTDAETWRQASRACRRPLWIDSFYVKGADSGLSNLDGRGFEVRTQADRGRYYQHVVLTALESRVVIGWQWFRFEDVHEPPSGSGLTYTTNKGVVDAAGRPYRELLDAMGAINRQRYQLCDRIDAGQER